MSRPVRLAKIEDILEVLTTNMKEDIVKKTSLKGVSLTKLYFPAKSDGPCD